MPRFLPLLPLLLFLIGCALQPVTDPRRSNPAAEPTMVPTSVAIEKPTYSVERGVVTSQLFKSGRVTPVIQSQLSFTLNGSLAILLADKGEMVNAGDVVAMLDTTILEQSLRAVEADLTLAEEQLALAQESKAMNLRRAEIGVELVQLRLDFARDEAGDTPTVEPVLAIELLNGELELAQLNLSELDRAVDPALTNQITQIQFQLESIRNQITLSSLVAPISGEVTAVNVQEGDNVSAGDPVFMIADLNTVEVQVSLIDRELQALSEGMAAIAISPTRPEITFPMTVRQLPFPYGTGAQGNEADSFVRVSFDDPTQVTDLAIGERLEVAILLDRHESVLWLPPAAIREFNGRFFVVVQEGESQKRVDIKIALQNDNQVEIISGVSEGQVVVGP